MDAGQRWASPDGRWRWDGTRWLPTAAPPGLPPPPGTTRGPSVKPGTWLGRPTWPLWVVFVHCAWLAGLTMWLAVLIAVADKIGPDGHLSHTVGGIVVALAALGMLTTIWFGGWLAAQRRWTQLLIAPVLGCCALVFWYVIAFSILQPNDPQADNEAGAGVAILGVPTFVLIAALLGLGAGGVAIWHRGSGRRHARIASR
jgi:ABC-type Na+ efflux pump permease subunit